MHQRLHQIGEPGAFLEAAAPGADEGAETGGLKGFGLDAGVINRELGGAHRQMDHGKGELDGLAVLDEVTGLEIFHLPRGVHADILGIETGERSDAGFAGAEPLPVFILADAQRGNDADPGYDCSPFHMRSPRRLLQNTHLKCGGVGLLTPQQCVVTQRF